MFERFTERARQIVVLAQELAREFESDKIDLEHLLLACYTEEGGVAARVLRSLSVTEGALRDLVPFGTAGKRLQIQLPFTDEAKSVFELALREALALGHNYIGTEHILLGIIRENPDLVSKVVASEHLRSEVMRYLSGPKSQRASDTPQSLVVSFEIKPGQVWVDRENNTAWYVKTACDGKVVLERTLVETYLSHRFVRQFRQMGSE